MNDELHPAPLVKKTLGNDSALRRDIAEHGPAFKNVLNGLGGARFIKTTLLLKP